MPDTLYKQNGDVIVNHRSGDEECVTLFDTVRGSFPWFDLDFHVAASDPYIHEVFNEQVIRTCFRTTDAEEMVGKTVATAHRMFCMDSQTSFVITTDLFEDEQPSWKPPQSHVIACTNHYEEYGKPAPTGFDSFKEYFVACSSEVAAESFGVNIENTNSDTLYTVLVDNDDNIITTRRYTNYIEGDGVLANWQGIYVFFCKRAKRMDLARQLFALNL